MSEYQKMALEAIGLITNFTVFQPTESAEEQGYCTVFMPLEEGQKKWQEYKDEGLDEFFYYFEEKA